MPIRLVNRMTGHVKALSDIIAKQPPETEVFTPIWGGPIVPLDAPLVSTPEPEALPPVESAEPDPEPLALLGHNKPPPDRPVVPDEHKAWLRKRRKELEQQMLPAVGGNGKSGMGKLLRELREQQGVTQRHLSRMAGVSRGALVKIETDVREGNISTLNRLFDAMGYEIEVVMKDEKIATRSDFSRQHKREVRMRVKEEGRVRLVDLLGASDEDVTVT